MPGPLGEEEREEVVSSKAQSTEGADVERGTALVAHPQAGRETGVLGESRKVS